MARRKKRASAVGREVKKVGRAVKKTVSKVKRKVAGKKGGAKRRSSKKR